MSDKEVKGRIILGSGRSGTTWVLDSLAEANELRPVFEPLHEKESELGKRFAYGLMEPGDCDEALERYFMDLSEGKIHSRWIDYRGATESLFPSPFKLMKVDTLRGWLWKWRKYFRDRSTLKASVGRQITLIKCIRANLMAGWFAHDLGFKTILIVRHPCAVIESQFRNEVVWDPTQVSERYRSNKQLHEKTHGKYLALLHSSLTRLEALTLNWIIENQCPLELALNQRYVVFHYEHLLQNPTVTWLRICEALDLHTVPNVGHLRKPSQQSSIDFIQDESAFGVPRWQRSLKTKQLAEIQAVLDATECGFYNVNEEAPLVV
jgi:hypothetical protein